jgi:outer membrane receptor for ferrienterochelin and colicins
MGQQITGYVLDQEGPLEFANILLESSNYGSISDEQGFFKIENIKPGSYTLQVSMLGYKGYSLAIDIKPNDKIELGQILLHDDALGLREVVVTGSMKPTFVTDSPIKVDVITAKQLNTFLPAASSSIVENVQLINGVQEVIACGVCYTNSISINGLPGPYTAVLMDGTPIYGNLASVYGLNGIPNMIIDRFEVIKGPSSTLYGSEAVAGVINIITKDPEKQAPLSVDIMGTSHWESFGNIAAAPKIGNSKGFIGLNYAYINNFEDDNVDGFGDGINLDRYSLFSKWDLYRKSGKKFTLAGKYYYEDRRNGVEEFLTNRNYRNLRGSDQIYGESIYTNRAEIFGTYELNVPANVKMDFSLSHHDQDSYYGSDAYKASQQIAFANLIWNPINAKSKHDLLLGLTSRYNAYDDNSVATERMAGDSVINQPNNQFIPGLFVQDEFSVLDNFTVLSGLRLDHYDSHGLIFAPRLSLKYKPGDWTTLRSNFGTGFRVVNLFTEDHAFITGQRTVEIVEELRPEESYNVSFNINQVYAAFGGSGTIDIESYFTHFTNKILPNYDTPGKIIYENSDGFARTMGIGLSITHSLTIPLSFNVGVNLQKATETEPNELDQMVSRNIEFAPEWSGVLTLNYEWKKANILFGYTLSATGPMALPEVFDLDENGQPQIDPRPTRSTAFALHNLQVSKTFSEHFSIYGGIQNLTNFRQRTSPLIGYNDPNTPIGFSNYFDTSYAYAPNHGREFYLGIKWNLER